MGAKICCRSDRPAGVRRTIVTASALVTALAAGLVSHVRPVSAQAAAQSDTAVFSIIVTRHGVRAPSDISGSSYDWANWDEVKPDDLTAHGYRLMRQMGRFYLKTQGDKGLPVDCPGKTAYVYADTAQRTLATAHALIEGLCGSPAALEVFHAAAADDKDGDVKFTDPIFDATEWISKLHKIDVLVASRAAVAAVAGSPPSSLVMQHRDAFSAFQGLLNTRCHNGGCQPIAAAASAIQIENLAGLKGPIATASVYSEDVFLEYAQCRPLKEMTDLRAEQLRAALQAGMRLHVLAYEVDARNTYNPLVRAGTLLAHVVAMLDQKAGRRDVLRRIGIPDLEGKTLVILSGHDTQLGALGGILNAHWNPEGGNVRDDMPPGSALMFDLVKRPGGAYGVRLSFVAMALDQYRAEQPFGGPLTRVDYTGCPGGACLMPLSQFESLALTLDAQGLVDQGWDASPKRLQQDPGSVANLKDPHWTEPQCRGP